MNLKKTTWNKPTVLSIDSKETKETIFAFACSQYEEGCWPAGLHLQSVGKPPVEIM